MMKDGERGELFPTSMSPFAYNETVAQNYFPLTKEKTQKKGFLRKEDEDNIFTGEEYLPKNISVYQKSNDKREQLLAGIIKCRISGKPFKITKQELDFYIKNNLPIPNKHPDIRHEERIQLRNPRTLFDRKCDKYGINMKTTYKPNDGNIIYCENCYSQKVYG